MKVSVETIILTERRNHRLYQWSEEELLDFKLTYAAMVRHIDRNFGKVMDSLREKGADCILVLGAKVKRDGSPSYMLKDRLDAGIALYQSGAAPKLLMSGDHGRVQYDEVNRMKQYAIDRGVPSRDVFMDHAGFSTYESMYRARDVFQVQRALVVTQEYHLYRALYDGKQLGLEVWGVPAKKIRYGGQRRRDIREILAMNKDILFCLVRPEPKYLGEAIPVSGDGDLTND